MAGPDEGCPAAFYVCLSTAAAAQLEAELRRQEVWTRRAKQWMQEAMDRCGPQPAHPP